jgi:uridine kinase
MMNLYKLLVRPITKIVRVLCVQVDPADVIILEGILVLHIQELRDHCNMLVYVDTGGDRQQCTAASHCQVGSSCA